MPCAAFWGFGTALHEASHRLPTSPGGVLPSRPNPSARHAVGPWLFSEKNPRHENFFSTLENIFSTLDKKFSRQGKKFSSVDVFLENIGGPPTPFLRCVRRMGVFGFCTGGAFPVLPIPPLERHKADAAAWLHLPCEGERVGSGCQRTRHFRLSPSTRSV